MKKLEQLRQESKEIKILLEEATRTKEFNERSTLWNKVEMAEKILMHN